MAKRAKRPAPPNRRKLTVAYVQRVRPEDKVFLTWDTHQRSLVLSVEPTGYRSFKVIYSRRGRPRWYTIGAADAIGLKEAREEAAAIMLQVIRGRDPAAEKRAERGAGTFAELYDRYLEEYAKRRNKSWKQSERWIRKFLLPRWGKLPAKSI